MMIRTGNGHIVELVESDRLGSAWIVRVYRKKMFRKRLVSSDWFLDRSQAEQFAEQAAATFRAGGDSRDLMSRAPGWTLRRPSR
ncbi:MAG: hypothetical protein AB1428_06590 [Bacteroidota bacterium]